MPLRPLERGGAARVDGRRVALPIPDRPLERGGAARVDGRRVALPMPLRPLDRGGAARVDGRCAALPIPDRPLDRGGEMRDVAGRRAEPAIPERSLGRDGVARVVGMRDRDASVRGSLTRDRIMSLIPPERGGEVRTDGRESRDGGEDGRASDEDRGIAPRRIVGRDRSGVVASRSDRDCVLRDRSTAERGSGRRSMGGVTRLRDGSASRSCSPRDQIDDELRDG